MTGGKYGSVPDDFLNIEAAKEAGLSWIELEKLPVWRRNLLIAKVSQERKAKADLEEREARNARRRK